MGNSMLSTALRYYDKFGWCVIPIPYGRKAARIKWGRYQDIRPDRAQAKKWFGSGPTNVAVVLGEVSGGLCCRDFDTVEGYRAWADAHCGLADLLPTAKTARGYHVYFLGQVNSIVSLGDGELRGRRSYCLLPPSVHPDGSQYVWITEPIAQPTCCSSTTCKRRVSCRKMPVLQRKRREQMKIEEMGWRGEREELLH